MLVKFRLPEYGQECSSTPGESAYTSFLLLQVSFYCTVLQVFLSLLSICASAKKAACCRFGYVSKLWYATSEDMPSAHRGTPGPCANHSLVCPGQGKIPAHRHPRPIGPFTPIIQNEESHIRELYLNLTPTSTWMKLEFCYYICIAKQTEDKEEGLMVVSWFSITLNCQQAFGIVLAKANYHLHSNA